MKLFELFIIAGFAVYCLTTIINELDGPAQIFQRLRIWIGVVYDERGHGTATNWRAEAVLCFFCLSVWVGLFITLLTVIFLVVGRFAEDEPPLRYIELVALAIMPFATSGVAMFFKKLVG